MERGGFLLSSLGIRMQLRDIRLPKWLLLELFVAVEVAEAYVVRPGDYTQDEHRHERNEVELPKRHIFSILSCRVLLEHTRRVRE